MIRKIDAISLATLTVILPSSAPPESGSLEPRFEFMPEVEQVEVACVDVNGPPDSPQESLPTFTKEICDDLAQNVQLGLNEFSELTGGAIDPPHVRPRLLTGAVQIDDALEIRCTNYDKATPVELGRIKLMVNTITNAALAQIEMDPKTGLVIAANGSPDLCRKELPPNVTERCTDTETRRAVLGGRALHETTGLPAVFIFAAPGQQEKDLSLIEHEWGHLGLGSWRLGHDFALCNLEGDSLPSRIGYEPLALDTDIRSDKGSIMGYSDNIENQYIAPPHLANLGLIPQDRIITPERSGIITLSDMHQTGPAGLQVELNNPAIEEAIAKEVSKVNFSVDDYVLYIGKMPGLAEVGVYAAPTQDALRASNGRPPIILIQRFGPKKELDIAGGPKIEMISGNQDVVRINYTSS